jgi:N-acetylmuramoyl-L-alanine amidase
MTNLHEAEDLMGNKAFWEECAVEIAKGLCEYLKIEYVPKTATTASAKKAEYTIQVGFFSVERNAQNLHDSLTKAGFKDSVVTGITTSGQTKYKVQIGSFGKKEDAKELQQKLNQAGYKGSIITEI